MLRAQLRAGGEGVELLVGHVWQGADHRRHLRRAVGQGAGLVKGHAGDAGKALQSIAFAHEKAVVGGVADGGHDRRGRGQNQRAGAKDDEYGHGADDLAADEPCKRRRRKRDDHDPRGPAVGDADDLCLARVGGLHQTHHALDGAVLAHARGAHLEGAELVDRAAHHLVAHALIHRQGFAGHHRLIDGGLAGSDNAVHRHRLAGQHAQKLADAHFLGGDGALFPIPHHARRARREVDEALDAGAGARHGHLFQQAAQLHDEGHFAGGEILADDHRGDEGDGDEHVRLDVKGRDKADDGFEDDGHAAEDDGHPRRVERQRQKVKDADEQRDRGNGQKGYVLARAAPFEEPFQCFHVPAPLQGRYGSIIHIGV